MAIIREQWDSLTDQQQWDLTQHLAEAVENRESLLEAEIEIGNLLGQAWNKFNALPVLHHSDLDDFTFAIHAAQNIILARTGLRATGIYRPGKSEKSNGLQK